MVIPAIRPICSGLIFDDSANILVCVPSELKRRVERSLSGIPRSRWPVGRWIGRNQTASELDNSLKRLRFVIGTPRYWSAHCLLGGVRDLAYSKDIDGGRPASAIDGN